MDDNNLVCRRCEKLIEAESDFCPDCGNLFVDAACFNHENTKAEGACVICNLPFCNECGKFVNEKFLCSEHCDYEIYQSMANVFNSNDSLLTETIKIHLIEKGFHPFVFSRSQRSILDGSETHIYYKELLDVSTDQSIELLIMVPFCEVLEAESVIDELDDSDNNN